MTAAGASRGSTPLRGLLLAVVHLLALWALAVAQPLYDVLRRNGDFFIAHRTTPLDLVLFTGLVSIGVPLVLAVPYVLVAPWWPRAGRVVLIGLIGLLSAMLASQLMAHTLALPTVIHYAVAMLVGGGAAWLYASQPLVGGFLTALSISVPVCAVLFLLHPSMAAFARPERGDTAAAAAIGDAPPIVFVVFDQLPITSLLDSRGEIDRQRYPGFASLADSATWYRNASTMADFTGWALPPIVSGLKPHAARVPTSRSYPSTLFTWLGDRYRMEVQEPITQLCPERLCDAGRNPLALRLASMTLDSSVVYARAASPAGVRAHLPPLTDNWKDFIRDQRWQRRWASERESDRRRVPEQLIEAIGRDDPQPTLYFAHVLLPHEPYVYLRSGQEFTSKWYMAGLKQRGHWTSNPWPVTLAYRRHLLQVGYVDALVGRLIDRLEAEGLYDRALVIVTSDHGVSFRPGLPFKGLNGQTIGDTTAVPLFIKAPGQRQGAIDDTNMQSMDIMPTISRMLRAPLTWRADGRPAGDERPATKTIYYTGATKRLVVDLSSWGAARDASAARKSALFGDGPGWQAPAPSRRDLVGRRVDGFQIVNGPFQAKVDSPEQLLSVSLQAPQLPAMITGQVTDADGRATDADVAVALGGVIAAVTTTFQPEDERRGSWAALVDPSRLMPGRNDIQVFVLPRDGSPRLHLAYASRERPEHLNLASRGAHDVWGVQQTGFYPREGSPIAYRWTAGDGSLVVPLEAERPPRSLRVGLAAVRPGGTRMTVSLNGCTLFDDTVATVPWHRTFSLRGCPRSTLDAPQARIVIKSPPWTPAKDPRQLGVAVETVNLFQDDWPLTNSDEGKTRGAVGTAEPLEAPHEAGRPIGILVANVGESTWVPASDAPKGGHAVQLALRWQAASRRGPEREQRLDLPWPLYPTDRALIHAPMAPPGELNGKGPWKVKVEPVQPDGVRVPVESELVIDVIDSRP